MHIFGLLVGFPWDGGEVRSANARGLPHSLHHSHVESHTGIWVVSKLFMRSVKAALCAQAPAENPGTAVATDCRITVLQTATYSTLMRSERQGFKQVPNLTLPFAG